MKEKTPKTLQRQRPGVKALSQGYDDKKVCQEVKKFLGKLLVYSGKLQWVRPYMPETREKNLALSILLEPGDIFTAISIRPTISYSKSSKNKRKYFYIKLLHSNGRLYIIKLERETTTNILQELQ